MPLLQWIPHEFIGCLEVLPTIAEYEVEYEFEVNRGGATLRLSIWQYESVIHLALGIESADHPLIELTLYVRGATVWHQEGSNEYLKLMDCVLAGSRFSYIEMGNV